MRLTLRTLLAYLDDVLDPVDKEELAQKIQSSEFAEDLVHRTRDTVRRLRLSAPQVVGTGMGLDPNTVAEYLDNVMPPEQVGDFERICLESDVHLAEATACHHVLTMILGEPADVDPLAKQRMFSIATEAADRKRLRIEPAHMGPAAVAPAAAALSPAPTPMPELPSSLRPRAVEVPDYLRAGSWWRSTGAVVALAAIVLIGITVLFASGLRGWFGNKSATLPPMAQNTAPAPDATAASAPQTEAPPMETADNAAVKTDSTAPKALAGPPQPMTPGLAPIATTPAPSTPAAPALPPAATTEPDRYAVNTNPPAAAPQSNFDVPTAGSPSPSGVEPSAQPAAGAPTGLALPAAAPPATVTAPPLSPPATAVANDGGSLPPTDNLAASNPVPPSAAPLEPAASAPVAGDVPSEPKSPASTAPPDCGTYMGGETVLLRYDEKAVGWFRVDPRAAVVPGERVLALPEFRPKIALVSGVHLDLSGGTQVVMGGGDARASAKQAEAEFIPTIELVYGRAVLINPTNGEKQIRLRLGSAIGTAKLARNATLAVEVERKHVPGLDPRQTAAPVDVRLFAPDGGVVWQDAAGEKTAAKASRWTLTDSGASDMSPDPAPPEWIDHEPIILPSEQRYGAPVIRSSLASNAPAETQLLELFQGSSRKEVKSLVARSSIYVGVFQPFVEALRDSEQKASWKTHIDTLRTAMALSPESANKVYQALVDQRGKPAAADLFEMLCGYNADQVGHSPDQMKTGAIPKLINWLEDDSLDYRVLAVQDLWEITGKRLMLNPAAKLPERTQNVKRWRSQLESGDLKVVAPAG